MSIEAYVNASLLDRILHREFGCLSSDVGTPETADFERIGSSGTN